MPNSMLNEDEKEEDNIPLPWKVKGRMVSISSKEKDKEIVMT